MAGGGVCVQRQAVVFCVRAHICTHACTLQLPSSASKHQALGVSICICVLILSGLGGRLVDNVEANGSEVSLLYVSFPKCKRGLIVCAYMTTFCEAPPVKAEVGEEIPIVSVIGREGGGFGSSKAHGCGGQDFPVLL